MPDADVSRLHGHLATTAMYLCLAVILGFTRLASGFTQLQPIITFDTFAIDSHWACVYILADVEDANESICKPQGYFPDLSHARSYNVRYCSQRERRAEICHARFQCQVLKDFDSCSKEELSHAMRSDYVFRCSNDWTGRPTRIWINPQLEGDHNRAVAHCLYEEDWLRMTGTPWMESDERQYELQRVTIAALDVVAEHIGPDVTRCVDHFLRSGP